MDLFDWLSQGWDAVTNWFSNLDFTDIENVIDSVGTGLDKVGSLVSNVASNLTGGDLGLFNDNVSPLVSAAASSSGGASDLASSLIGNESIGNNDWVHELIGNVTKSESVIGQFWDSLGGKEKAAILQAGLAGIAGGAAAYLQNKQAKDLAKYRSESDKALIQEKGAQDRETPQYKQNMNQVPTRKPFVTATPGATPKIMRPSGKPLYGTQDQLGIIQGAMQ